MSSRVQRATRWSLGTALWILALLVVTPVAGFVFAPVLDAVIAIAPGWLATAAIEAVGSFATTLLGAGLALLLVAAMGVLGYRLGKKSDVAVPLASSFLVPGMLALLLYGMAPVAITLRGVLLVGATGVPPYVFVRLEVAAAEGGTDYARRGVLRRLAGAGSLIGALAIGASEDAGASAKPPRSTDPFAAEYKRLTGRTVGSNETGNVTAVETSGEFGFDFAGMPPRIGDIEDHYVVDVNTRDPTAASEDWRLSVTGAVETEASFTLQELIDHPDAVSVPCTLICVSNPVGGELISTTTWQVVPLSAIAEQVDVLADDAYVVTRGVDGYSESIPLDAVRDEAFVAFGADGATLPVAHGFPARLLVPGRYGFKSTKWLTTIEFSQDDHEAYWERRGWAERATVNTLSYARAVAKRGDEIAIGGIAFAGTRGIDAVEISRDGGDTWTTADLEPAPSRFSWNRWRHLFTAHDDATVDIVVRARDGTGSLQTRERTSAHPDGATGWHHETFHL